MIDGVNHFTVLTDDLDRSLDFYADLLGLTPGPRPAFDFPGAWLYAGGQAVLHLVASRDLPSLRAGIIDHVAFTASGLADIRDRLEARGVAYELRPLPGWNVLQLFCRDPNGARIELDFAGEREGAA